MAFDPIVMVRVAPPRPALVSMLMFAAELPLPEPTPDVTAPIVKSPPIVKLVNFPVKVRLAFAASVPPLIVNAPAPMAFTPPRMIVPALRVKPPGYVFPFDEKKIPLLLLMNPVPAAVDIAWLLKSSAA